MAVMGQRLSVGIIVAVRRVAAGVRRGRRARLRLGMAGLRVGIGVGLIIASVLRGG